MAEITVGVDIGTSSVKAVAADADGRVVSRARIPHAMHVPAPDLLEHDAAVAWVDGVRAAVDALDAAARRDALAIGVSAMVPSMCAVGADGRPVTPGLLYGDARGRAEGVDAANPAGNREAMTFLSWCAGQAPDARGYWPAQAVASVALGGPPVIDTSTAATTWPLFDGTGWAPDHLAELGVRDDQMPAVMPAGEPAGKVGDLMLIGGAVDALGEQIVTDVAQPGDVLVMCGTTLMVWIITDHYVADAAPLWCIPWHVPGTFAVGGPSNAGGLFLGWVQRMLAPEADDGTVDPARVPVWAPYPRGERVPWHDHTRRASLHDVDLTMGAPAVRRAAFEAAGFMVADILERSQLAIHRLVASGGGTRVPGWVQAMADCTGRPVEVSAVQEGAALGMAFLGRLALGKEGSLLDARRWASIEKTVDPDPAWTSACAARLERFREVSANPS
ncbi:MAG TPA: FGGY-family carbohydrate kinase [Mycobacteriales bacterium]|nr:FGGY-family carbohydrate kinase [Mycobacteriales bacterium]